MRPRCSSDSETPSMNFGQPEGSPMFDVVRRLAGLLMTVLGATTALTIAPSRAESVLRIVMGSDVKVIDPVWTPAYPTRNHGYMIYDTLFAMNDKFEIMPQM